MAALCKTIGNTDLSEEIHIPQELLLEVSQTKISTLHGIRSYHKVTFDENMSAFLWVDSESQAFTTSKKLVVKSGIII